MWFEMEKGLCSVDYIKSIFRFSKQQNNMETGNNYSYYYQLLLLGCEIRTELKMQLETSNV